MTKSKQRRYILADAHGIDSMHVDDGIFNPFVFHMRARCNIHRHAVLFAVDLFDDEWAAVDALLAKDEYDNALTMVITLSRGNFMVAPSDTEYFKRTINRLPDPTLDPYHTPETPEAKEA